MILEVSKYSLKPSYHLTPGTIKFVLNAVSIILPYLSLAYDPDTDDVNVNEAGFIPSPIRICGIDNIDAD